MIRPEHIYGDSTRLFLNTELGCTSACTYCYLPEEGFKIGLSKTESSPNIDGDLLLKELLIDSRVKFGTRGTLFSIGCFSEAWDPRNRKSTIQIIKALLYFGNPIQLATKRKVGLTDLCEITNNQFWNNQLTIYISSATISHWNQYEPLTIEPKKRFESFSACREAGVQACLYIKPLIPSITILDTEIYGKVIEKHHIPIIVGDRFTNEKLNEKSPISKSLFVIHDEESVIMREQLSFYGPVFSKSEEALIYFRKNK